MGELLIGLSEQQMLGNAGPCWVMRTAPGLPVCAVCGDQPLLPVLAWPAAMLLLCFSASLLLLRLLPQIPGLPASRVPSDYN
jgi:hypothetical protein